MLQQLDGQLLRHRSLPDACTASKSTVYYVAALQGAAALHGCWRSRPGLVRVLTAHPWLLASVSPSGAST